MAPDAWPRTRGPRPFPRKARLHCPGTAAVAVRRQPVPGATTGIAVTARGTGVGISALPGAAQQAGHLVVFGSTGPRGPAKPVQPGRTQLRRIADGESVGG